VTTPGDTAGESRVRLLPLHEKIVYAEKHRRNYDIYFELEYAGEMNKKRMLVEEVNSAAGTEPQSAGRRLPSTAFCRSR
jgi:hypothetical protein